MSNSETPETPETSETSETSENENTTLSSDSVETAIDETVDTAEIMDTTESNLLSNIKDLKESNPKVFFGAIGGVVALIVIAIMMMSGGSKKMPHTSFKSLSVGQEYVLKGANSMEGQKSTVSMVGAPGAITAFDDTVEEGDKSVCKQQPEGTTVKVIKLQDFAGKQGAFAQVEILAEGACQGKKGWILSIDID
ncbi:MAG: hypothetical protein Q9M50_03125 [Methylococcales bacterium]|nr:hypothetical protein [Methylococcales bacterium]